MGLRTTAPVLTLCLAKRVDNGPVSICRAHTIGNKTQDDHGLTKAYSSLNTGGAAACPGLLVTSLFGIAATLWWR